ncbi:hypothetical protein GN956_G22580 [Arapaima gigas]
MSLGWLMLSMFLQEANSIIIYNSIYCLCLQDILENNTVQLTHCDVNADVQQWSWKDQHLLMNKVTKRCLSTHQVSPVLTVPCDSSHSIWWTCHSHRLISYNDSLELTTDGKGLFLSRGNKLSKWKTLKGRDICKEKLRSRRESDDQDEFDMKEEEIINMEGESMPEEQREYNNMEEVASWKYSMLALSSASLLTGCVLLIKDVMGNRTRKKTIKHKSAALAMKGEELQSMTDKKSCGVPAQDSEPGNKCAQDDHDAAESEMGDPGFECNDQNGSPLHRELLEEDV